MSQPRVVDRDVNACVFCQCDKLEERFTLTFLGRHEGHFFECSACRSIQICRVDWLAEAYNDAPACVDTGLAQRGLVVSLFARAMRKSWLLRRGARVVDYGTGSGMLVRMLRDQGFDAHGYDKYVRSVVAGGFVLHSLDHIARLQPDLITVIDVLEHLVDPRETLADLAARQGPGGLLLIRTPLYDARRHRADWEGLGREHGQHISLPSRQGMHRLAQSIGLRAHVLPMGFILLTRPDRPIGLFRSGLVTLWAGWYFFLARSMGLCRFENALRDIRLLMANQEPKR